MELDDDDYALLGYGGGEVVEESYAKYVSLLLAKRQVIDQNPVLVIKRYVHLKRWRAKNRPALLEHERRYSASEKGKRSKKKKNKTYYEKNRAVLLEKLKARRKKEKAEREQR